MPSRAGKVHLKSAPEQLRQAGLLLEPDVHTGRIDLAALFGNSRPVEAEIGPGKGAFILGRAQARSELNLLGIEWVPSYGLYVADRVLRAGLPNVRAVIADAATFVRQCLPDASLLRMHIYFPDPWPKTRHHRRRLIQWPFLNEVRRVLVIGGWLGIVTDHDEYFRHVRTILSSVSGLAEVPFPDARGDELLVGSNFERKYREAGRRFHALAALRYR